MAGMFDLSVVVARLVQHRYSYTIIITKIYSHVKMGDGVCLSHSMIANDHTTSKDNYRTIFASSYGIKFIADAFAILSPKSRGLPALISIVLRESSIEASLSTKNEI